MNNIKLDTYRYILDQIRAVDNTLTREIERRFVSIGLNKKSLNSRSLLLGAFITNIIQLLKSYNPSINYLKSSWIFMKRSGDILDIRNFVDEEKSYIKLLSISDLSEINEDLIKAIAKAIKVYAKALLMTSDIKSLEEFSLKLRESLESEYDVDIKEEGGLELLRESLSILFLGSRRLADLYMYTVIRVFNLWPEKRDRLRPIVTSKMYRPLREMGLLRHNDDLYLLGKQMFPEDPSIISVFNLVATKWCKLKKKYCTSCPFYVACLRL